MDLVGYKSITFTETDEAVIFLDDGRELTVPSHVAERLLRTRAEEGLAQIAVTRATSATPVVENGVVAESDLPMPAGTRSTEPPPLSVNPDPLVSKQWKVTIGCQVDEVTDDPRFLALFKAALVSDPEVSMIQFGEPSLSHGASAVLLISAAVRNAAEALGKDILKRNLHVAARALIGDKPYDSILEVRVEPFPSPFD